MITRVWHGRTKREDADTYRDYVIRTGVRDYRSVKGNLGVQIWQRDEGDITHFWTISLWENLASIRSFAGEDVDRARYYPDDARFLLELEPRVKHYRSLVFPETASPNTWRITI